MSQTDSGTSHNSAGSSPAGFLLIWLSTVQKKKKKKLNTTDNIQPPSFSLFFFFFSSFFKHAFVVAEKVKRFFFLFPVETEWAGSEPNIHKANFPWCSGNIITPKHHSFRMTYGFIYKKKTSVTPINSQSVTGYGSHVSFDHFETDIDILEKHIRHK